MALGLSFLPTNQAEARPGQLGQPAESPYQQAVKLLSLRMPRFLGPRGGGAAAAGLTPGAYAPGALFGGAGSGGGPDAQSLAIRRLLMLLQGQGGLGGPGEPVLPQRAPSGLPPRVPSGLPPRVPLPSRQVPPSAPYSLPRYQAPMPRITPIRAPSAEPDQIVRSDEWNEPASEEMGRPSAPAGGWQSLVNWEY